MEGHETTVNVPSAQFGEDLKRLLNARVAVTDFPTDGFSHRNVGIQGSVAIQDFFPQADGEYHPLRELPRILGWNPRNP